MGRQMLVALDMGGQPITNVGGIGAASATLGTPLAVASGGTGQSTATAAFDALSPNTTRGDIAVRGASNNVRLAIGSAGKFLRSDGTDPSWQTIAESDVTNLVSDLAAKQPLDADLTALAGLTATTDNFVVAVASAWASRTPAQVRTTLGLVIGTNVQAWDADLDTIATLTPTTNNFMVASGSAWASRTPAQAIAHLGLDADLATFALPASTTISTFGASLIDDAAASNARTTLGLGTTALQNDDNVFLLDGTVNYGSEGTGLLTVLGSAAAMFFRLGTNLDAATALGGVLASLAFTGTTDAIGGLQSGAIIRSIAEETFAAGHSGSRLEFRTTAITGSVTPGLRMNITSAGTLNIAPSYTSSLTTGGTFAVKADGSIWGGGGLAYTSNEPSDANFKVSTAGNGTFKGTLGVTGHVTLEGVVSTGATGTGKLVYDGSPTLVTPVIGAATGTSLAVTGALTSSGTAGVGYATGAGGTVSQATSRTTTVVLSKLCGRITLFSTTLAADTDQTFTWTNTLLAATDVVLTQVITGAAVKGCYGVTVACSAGSAQVTIHNLTPTITATEAPQIQFVVLKGVNA